MNKKRFTLILTLLIVFFHKTSSEIIRLELLINDVGTNVLVIGDQHTRPGTFAETQHQNQAKVLYEWLLKISKTNSCVYIHESEPKNQERFSKVTIEENLSQCKGLIDFIEFLDIKHKSKINNLSFFAADIRNENKLDNLVSELETNKEFEFDALTLDSFYQAFRDYLIEISRNILPKIKIRNSSLNKLMQQLINYQCSQLEIIIQQWEKEIDSVISYTEEEADISKKDSDILSEKFKKIYDEMIIKIADIGFILSIFEALNKKSEFIILHVGDDHAKNIIKYFCDQTNKLNFKEKKYFFYKSLSPISSIHLPKILDEISESLKPTITTTSTNCEIQTTIQSASLLSSQSASGVNSSIAPSVVGSSNSDRKSSSSRDSTSKHNSIESAESKLMQKEITDEIS